MLSRKRCPAVHEVQRPSELKFMLPWLRVSLPIRQIRSTTWDSATWPTVKQTLKDALTIQAKMRRWGWWN